MKKNLDMEILRSKECKIISTEEVLKDVEPFLTEEEIEKILKNKEIKAEKTKITNTRKVKIFKDEKWIDIEFENLKTGDKFRLFESTGEEVKNENGFTNNVDTLVDTVDEIVINEQD